MNIDKNIIYRAYNIENEYVKIYDIKNIDNVISIEEKKKFHYYFRGDALIENLEAKGYYPLEEILGIIKIKTKKKTT